VNNQIQHPVTGASGPSIPEDALALRDALKGQYIGGTWRQGRGGAYRHVYAANHGIETTVQLAGAEDVRDAIGLAVAAKSEWRTSDPARRASLMNKLADLIVLHGEDFAQLQTIDTGFPISASRGLVSMMESWVRYYAGFCDKIEGGTHSQLPHGRYMVNREPYGIVAIMLTWNMPVSSVCMKAMAALAAGNCVVIKSPEMAPFGMMRFAELVEEAGFPHGVISVLCAGPEGGEALAADPRIGKISFTGGAITAAKVLNAAAPNITPTLFELGGKSACMIFEDADLDRAVPFATFFPFAASGQACILPTRMLVQDSIYDAVLDRVKAMVSTLVPGDPFDPATQFGPLISSAAKARIEGIVSQAKADGAGKLALGGSPVAGHLAMGAYFEPTLFVDVDPASSLFCNEAFGPVLAISRFSDEAEAIAMANGTRFGLHSYVWTRDIARALRVADAMEAGSAAINGFVGLTPQVPFGGYGISGYGLEGGREGLNEFLRSKTIYIGN
jgi:aldehyde dehydrogenase (NAD+)